MECRIMKYKLFTTTIDGKEVKTNSLGKKIYQRIEDDGKCYITCTENNPDFKEWVEAGNTPEGDD